MKAFYALQPKWFSGDHFYKVYIRQHDLCFALLSRQVYDEDSAERQLVRPARIIAPLMRIWAKRLIRRREENESLYDEMDLSADEFLARNRRNYRISKADIAKAEIDTKRRLWTAGTEISGTLWLTMRDMRRKQFILVGQQDTTDILRSISNVTSDK